MEIILDNLVKTYKGVNDSCDVTAVKGVSLHIPSNKIFGIIGKSGAGKSSLVRLISLLENPDFGSVFYDNKKVDNLVVRSKINFYICRPQRKKNFTYSLKLAAMNNRKILN